VFTCIAGSSHWGVTWRPIQGCHGCKSCNQGYLLSNMIACINLSLLFDWISPWQWTAPRILNRRSDQCFGTHYGFQRICRCFTSSIVTELLNRPTNMRLKQKRRKLLVLKYFLGCFIDFLNLMQSQVLVLLNVVQKVKALRTKVWPEINLVKNCAGKLM
jgi:hypothetical protein